MASDLGTLVRKVQSQSRDSGGGFITPEDIIDWLNEAYLDLAARHALFDEEVTTSISGTNTLSWPTDFELVEAVDVWVGDSDRAVFVDSPTWNAWLDRGGSPDQTIFRIFENQLELYPTPEDGTTVTLRYHKLPALLVNNEDVHLLPTQLERKLLEYAKAQSRFKDGDFSAGNNWLALYEQGLRPVSTGRERQVVGPFQLIPEPSAFDDDPGAMHLGG